MASKVSEDPRQQVLALGAMPRRKASEYARTNPTVLSVCSLGPPLQEAWAEPFRASKCKEGVTMKQIRVLQLWVSVLSLVVGVLRLLSH